MAHTTQIEGINFIHDGDPNGGDVSIVVKASQIIHDEQSNRVTIPYDTLKGFIAEMVRRDLIRLIEDVEDDVILGRFKL